MERFGRIYFLLVTSLCLLSCAKSEQAAPTADDLLIEDLQDIIDSKIGDDDRLKGVAVSIRLGYEKEYQLTGGISGLDEPMPTGAHFGIGSITKTVVATTILALEEEGLLGVDDPISDYLEIDFTNVNGEITIYELLNHFSGLRGYMKHEDLWPMVDSDPFTKIQPNDLVQYIGEPEFEPGARWEYSNSNYLILGLIIESATGKTVGEVMREKLWAPLGLKNMYFAANETVPDPIATPWRGLDDSGVLTDISSVYGAGYHSVFYCAADVFSTASDLSLFAQYLFSGELLSENTMEKMLTFYDLGDPVITGYGLGVREIFFPDRLLWGHTGGMRGYGTFMFYDPITHVSIAVLNNQSRSQNGVTLRGELYWELLERIFEEIERS